MKLRILFSLTFLCLIVFARAVNVVDLRCEYEKSPLGVDTKYPKFSWKLTSENGERGLNQLAYRVQVGKSTNTLDVWDSGIINSTQQANVLFEGKALESHTTYYWKVTIVDSKGSKASAFSSFTSGLYHASDWQGKWIKYPDSISANQQIWFRKNIKLNEKTGRAIAYVASLGNHEFYINGQKVDDRVLAPCLTNYNDRILYVGYDVTSLLKKGQNTLAIWYAPGWSRYEGARYDKLVKVQMEVTYKSGKAVSFFTDTEWKCKAANGISSDLCKFDHHGGEIIDATKYDPTWNATKCSEDVTWLNAGIGMSNLQLTAQLMPPTRKIGDPIVGDLDSLKSDSNKLRIFMGKNYVGWTEVKLTGMKRGDTIKVKFCDDNSFLTQWDQVLIYVCSGDKDEVASNHFNYSAGGYITFEGIAKENIISVTGHSLGNDLDRTGYFTSSDSLINQIYETDLHTYRSLTTEGYTSDCPHRERLGYGEESFATAWGIGFPNYNVYSYIEKHIQDWIDVQDTVTGRILNTAPQTYKGSWGGPLWGSAGVNLALEFYKNTGDVNTLRKIYPSTKKWIGFLESKLVDHVFPLILKNEKTMYLGDWGMPDGGLGFGDQPTARFFNNCVVALNLINAIDILKVLQVSDSIKYAADLEHYTSLLKKMRTNIHKTFYNSSTGVYATGNMVQQAFAFLVGVVPDSCRQIVLTEFEKIKLKNTFLDMGSSGLPILLRYLEEETYDNDFMYKCLSKTTFPGYGYFVKGKNESCWPEFWADHTTKSATDYRKQHSHIHSCYTGIASWMTKCLGGICYDPKAPGMRNVIIKPYISAANEKLTSASMAQTTIYGMVKSAWTRNGLTTTLKCSIPVNSSATIYLPTKERSFITENGTNVSNVSGIQLVETKNGYSVYQIGSGTYNFGFTITE